MPSGFFVPDSHIPKVALAAQILHSMKEVD
jgi:hypothetical protein